MSGRGRARESWGAPSIVMRIIGVALALGGGTAHAADLNAATQGQPSDIGVGPCPTALEAGSLLSLARAVDLALCDNAQVRIAWASIRERAAAVGVARASYWPDLSVNASELNERAGYPGSAEAATNTTGKTVYGSLDWRLFDFGGRSSRYRAAESLLEAATASRDATIQQVLGMVVQAYFDAVTAKATLNDRIETESVAEQTLDSARRREAQGLASGNDSLQATAALERATLEHNRATADQQKALAVLVYVLGLRAGSAIILPTSLDAHATAGQMELAEWLKETERHHPAILAARAAVQAAREEVVSARSVDKPTIDLTANYYQNGFPNEGFASTNLRAATVGITVTVPLFDGFLAHYNIEQAQAAVKMSEEQLQQTRQATLMAVVEAYADARSAVRNVQVSGDLLHAAQAAMESSQRRYAHGVADIVELLNAQAALADARSERTRSLAEWHSARLRLLAAAGILDRVEFR
jgi:outer membrane protein